MARAMKRKIIGIGAVVLLTLLPWASAADIMGRWIARVPSRLETVETVTDPGSGSFRMPMAIPGETIFDFEEDGTTLVGTVSNYGHEGKIPIRDGKIDGVRITFAVIRRVGKNETKLVYTGTVGLNEIKFTRKEEGAKGLAEEFIAKREFLRHNGYVPSGIEAPGFPPAEPRRREVPIPGR